MNKFQIFKLNFSGNVTKMHYFRTNFQKSLSAGGSPPQRQLYLRFGWSEVAWFGQIVFFQTDYDEIKLWKMRYGVISVRSLLLRHRKTSP